MKFISEKLGLEKLLLLKNDCARQIASDYEHNAKSCGTCETPGACCLDAHFVNVRISRLESIAIRVALTGLSPTLRERVDQRVENSIEKYALAEAIEGIDRTYACPLFEKGIGCLVHSTAKPLPCIQHACYENEKDLPPDALLAELEGRVDRLNRRVFGKPSGLLSLPVAISKKRRN
ncbi:MAG: hypothetical protein ACR2IH_02650 [Pyrinomonadaceae bacterium]